MWVAATCYINGSTVQSPICATDSCSNDVWMRPASIREAIINGANSSTAQNPICVDAACFENASYYQQLALSGL